MYASSHLKQKTDGSYTPTFNWLRFAAEAYTTGRVNESQWDLTELPDAAIWAHSVTCHLPPDTSERTPP